MESGSLGMLTTNCSWTSFKTLPSSELETKEIARPRTRIRQLFQAGKERKRAFMVTFGTKSTCSTHAM